MSEVRLGVVHYREPTSGSQPSEPRAAIDLGTISLTADEVAAFRRAHNAIREFAKDAQFFEMVEWNFEDLSRCEGRFWQLHDSHLPSPDPRPPDRDLARLLLNLLAAARVYLDQTAARLTRRHGRDSDRVGLFNERCRAAYDSSFAYRFCYRLRNFALHRGLPITGITYSAALDRPRRLKIFVTRDFLLDDFDWGSLRQEIQALSGEIEILPLLAVAFSLLRNIHISTVHDDLVSTKVSAAEVLATASRVGDMAGTPCLFSNVVYVKDAEGRMRFSFRQEEIHVDLAHRIFNA